LADRASPRDTKETYATQFPGILGDPAPGRGLITAELDQTQNYGTTIATAARVLVQPRSRSGSAMNDQRPRGGLATGKRHYQFDYGVSDHPLGIVHRIGVSISFGGF